MGLEEWTQVRIERLKAERDELKAQVAAAKNVLREIHAYLRFGTDGPTSRFLDVLVPVDLVEKVEQTLATLNEKAIDPGVK